MDTESDPQEAYEQQKLLLRGKNRHDHQTTLKLNKLKLRQVGIFLDDDTDFSTTVFNNVKEKVRLAERKRDGRGKVQRKQKQQWFED